MEIPSHIREDVRGIVDEYLANIRQVTELILSDKVTLY